MQTLTPANSTIKRAAVRPANKHYRPDTRRRPGQRVRDQSDEPDMQSDQWNRPDGHDEIPILSLCERRARLPEGRCERRIQSSAERFDFDSEPMRAGVELTSRGDAAFASSCVVTCRYMMTAGHKSTIYPALYKAADGWKIVSNAFLAHPR